MSLQIRFATLADLESVYALFDLVDRLHRQAHPEIFQAVEPAGIKAYLVNELQAPDNAIFVAEEAGEMVGAVLAKRRRVSDNPLLIGRDYVSIENLVVAEARRQRGIGQALIEQVHHWAQVQGLHTVYLTVWEFNHSALALYHKLGYEMLHHRMRKELP